VIIFSTGSLYIYGLNRAFGLAQAAGFDGVEVLIDERWDTRQADYLLKLSSEYGMPIYSLHNPFDSKNLDGWEKKPVDRLDRTVELAKLLSSSVVVFHLPHYQNIACGRWLLNELPAYQRNTEIIIAVENMPHTRFLFGPLAFKFRRLRLHPVQLKTFWKLVTFPLSIPHVRLNKFKHLEKLPHLNFDTTHLGTGGFDILEAYERLKSKISHIHLSNYDLEKDQEHCLPMDGILPLDELLERLKRDNYQGAICVEVDPQALEAEREENVLRNMKESLEFCRKYYT